MIALFNSISGTVTKKTYGSVSSSLCLRSGDIEWIFEVSAFTLRECPGLNAATTVYTWLQHREDQFYLCGFSSENERQVFIELLRVEGVGPKQALKYLSGSPYQKIVSFIENADVENLETIPGLGKKTAQKLILALQGKLALRDPDDGRKGAGNPAEVSEWADVVDALVAMGYEKRAVIEATKSIEGELQALPRNERETEMMRRCIVKLS